ncbi:MAG: hypothetical protein EP343_11265 [Deltaproteobacteria bacterium]|nr:MAG: hypothetical protein EP343_11265 [Deltaproteobacteria bacterium]
MKKLCLGFLLVSFLSIVWVQGCSQGNNQEATTEVTAEAATETTNNTEATKETATGPEPGPEAGPEPGPEPGPEATLEDGPEATPEEATSSEVSDETVAEAEAVEETTDEASDEMLTDGGAGETTTDGGASDSPAQETVPEAPVKTFNFTGAVFDFFASGNPPIKDVKVCVHQQSQYACATTDASGKFTLYKLPHDTDLNISFVNTQKQLMPLIVPLNVPVSEIDGNGNYNHRVGLLSEQVAKLVALSMGVANVDLTGKAHIVADIHDKQLNTIQGATVTMTPTGGDGPHYLTATGTKNPKQETSQPGIAVYFNVPPGKTYSVTYKHTSKSCKAWPSTVRNTTSSAAQFEAFKGFLIVTSGLCQ